MNKKLAIIGIGKNVFNENLFIELNANLKITCICDLNNDKINKFLKEFSSSSLKINDMQILCSDIRNIKWNDHKDKIDIALVALPCDLNFECIKSLLIAGIHVIALKQPFVLNYLQLSELISISWTSSHAKLTCLAPHRYSKYLNKCKEEISSILIVGNIKSIRARKCLNLVENTSQPHHLHENLMHVNTKFLDVLISLFGHVNGRIESNLINEDNDDYGVNMLLSWLKFTALVDVNMNALFAEEIIEVTGTNAYMIIKSDETKIYDKTTRKLSKHFLNEEFNEIEMIKENFKEFLQWIEEEEEEADNDSALESKFKLYLNQELHLMQIIDQVFNNKYNKIKSIKCDYDWPRLTPQIEHILIEQMHSGLSIKTDRAEIRLEFENNFKEYLNAKDLYSLLCNSGK